MVVYTAIRGGYYMKKEEISNYRDVLTSVEVVQIGYRLAKFVRGEISYKVFETLMGDVGVTVSPEFVEIDPKKLSLSELTHLRGRINSKEFKPGDIECYVMSSKRHPAFRVRHDRDMIKTLAEYGDPKAKKTLELIKKKEVLMGR